MDKENRIRSLVELHAYYSEERTYWKTKLIEYIQSGDKYDYDIEVCNDKISKYTQIIDMLLGLMKEEGITDLKRVSDEITVEYEE